jgi:hypothetical protein
MEKDLFPAAMVSGMSQLKCQNPTFLHDKEK